MPPLHPIPQTLYHYCGVEAFMRIIETKSIMLSSVLGFNDYLETKWIVPLMREVFQEKRTRHNGTFFDTVKQHYNTNQTVPFMTCFSSDGDTLSQWRAYAADGAGFAIGFNPRYFPLEARAPWVSDANDGQHAIGISEVVYDRNTQNAYIRQTVDLHLEHCCTDDKDAMTRHAIDCATVLLRYSLIFKNPKFAEELEWRIIYVPTLILPESGDLKIQVDQRTISNMGFRFTDQAIIPYFELNFSQRRDEKPINEIVLGPKNDTQPFVVRMLLDSHGFEDVKITQSEASYR